MTGTERLSEDDLLRRIRSEFLEMPGLRLTRVQAQRLWTLDEQTCTRLLGALVEAKFLQKNSADQYGRFSDSTVERWRPRMAKVDVNLADSASTTSPRGRASA